MISSIKSATVIIINVLVLIGVVYFLIWVGFKGMIAFVAGMTLMTYLMLSKNPILRAMIGFAQAEDYIDDLRGDKDKKKQD